MPEINFELFYTCPRCGERSLEGLRSHYHCVNCLFSPVLDYVPGPHLGETQKLIERLDHEDNSRAVQSPRRITKPSPPQEARQKQPDSQP